MSTLSKEMEQISEGHAMHVKNEQRLQEALRLIKQHITADKTPQNRELHQAVQLIVDATRCYGHLQR